MIGDFVMIDGTPQKIEQITKKKVGYHLFNKCKMNYARLCEIEPIQISKEILEKNGFKQYGLSPVYGICDTNSYNNSTIDIKSGESVIRGEDSTICKQQMLYVHELQHALRLCGIDKEIKI